MGEYDITKTGTASTEIDSYQVTSEKIDGAESRDYWDFVEWPKRLGYYMHIPEYQRAVQSYATWVLGKGFDTDIGTQVILDNITGWGEDTIGSVLWNALVVKKVNGDSFTEIMRNDKGTLANLKPLDPERMRVHFSKKGVITHYEYKQADKEFKRMRKDQILHLVNDRIADQTHGTAASEAAEWVIETRQEMLEDFRRVVHLSTIRVLYIEEEDKTRRANLRNDYREAIEKGYVLILPGKKEDYQFLDLTVPPTEAFLAGIRYLENFFYQVVGVPPVISGGTEGQTEASAKVGYVVFEPNYIREITDLQADLFNQLGIKITFKKPASMMEGMQQQEQKNNAQTGFQPNDVEAGVGK